MAHIRISSINDCFILFDFSLGEKGERGDLGEAAMQSGPGITAEKTI